MSCFICNDETISVLAKAFVEYGVEFRGTAPKSAMDLILVDVNKRATEIGQLLLDQNYRSFNDRYRGTEKPHDFVLEDVTYDYGTVIGCMECYEYQASETRDWETCTVHGNLQSLRDTILKRLLKKCGYKVPYGYDGFDMLEG